MTDPITAWQCIGCGKIESTQECIGVCTDRRVAFFYEHEYHAVLQQLAQANERIEAQADLLRRLAWSTPRNDKWEEAYRRLQADARHLLA